jgi:hypothetical protein
MRRFLLSLVLALCGVAAVRAEPDLYNPLAVGLRWEVDVELTPPGGQAVQGTAVREITGTININGANYFVVTTSFTDLPTMKEFTMYRRKTVRAIYAINSLDKEKQEFLETVLPLTVGQTWKTTVFGRTITSTVEGKEAVKIGDKTYEDCMKISYKSGDGKMTGTFYQAPDVGNVQETTYAGGTMLKFTLKKFSGLK